ncbi:MAG: DUF3617 domain-containing protein [Nitrospira sp.]
MLKTTVALRALGVVVAGGLVLEFVIPCVMPDAQAESLNVKPGAWEMTVTTVASGMKLSPEMSARMTPQQRTQMEQMMKAREGKPHTTTAQSCITKVDVAHDRIIKEMEEEDDDEVPCKIKVISKSSSKLALDQICPGPPPSTTHFTIEAKTTESLAATGDREQSGSGKVHMDIIGRWLGAGCSGIDD